MKTMLTLLKENLGKAEMLRYVHVFNISDWSTELSFIFGTQDREQWEVGKHKILSLAYK